MKIVRFSNEIMVNIENVSSVKIIDNRLILNMNYCIVKHGNTIPDYIYIDKFTDNDINAINNNVGDIFIKTSDNVYINKNSISSIKIDKEKQKVIVNLAHPHTYNLTRKTNDGVKVNKSVIAEYIYTDFSIFDYL